jgi:hypothetical protein
MGYSNGADGPPRSFPSFSLSTVEPVISGWSDESAPVQEKFVQPRRFLVATSSLPSDFRIKQTVPKAPAAECPHRRPASGRLGPYELVEEIGRGGMGVVYSAQDQRGQLVALKVMREANELAPGVADRFRREAQVVAHIRHPNIVPVHELAAHGEQLFLVMDFVKGGTLGEHLKRFLADCQLTVRTMIKVARAVHHAHQLGILHRDLKPSNVLLDEQDEPKVTDFGLAKFPSAIPELSREGELIGTPAYMSPEQATGLNEKIGPATDVWGLGVILYELVTGLRPFPGGDQTRMLFAIQTARPQPPRQFRPLLDPTLEAIILRCLEKKPALRYPSAAALADDLERWHRGEPIQAMGCCGWGKRRVFGGLVLLAAAVALAITCLSFHKEHAPAQPVVEAIWSPLQREVKIDLLADGVLPSWHRWPLGPSQSLGSRPLTLDTYSPCLLQLVPSVPVSQYRMRVESLAYSMDLGASGLFFAHCEHDTGKERDQFYCALLCAETSRVHRLTLEVHRHREPGPPASNPFHAGLLFEHPLPAPSSTIASWHEVGIESTSEHIVVFWEGQRVGEIPWSSVSEMTNHLATLDPPITRPAPLSPATGAGVYVRRGSAAFRHFIFERVD